MLGIYNIEDYSRGRVIYNGLKKNKANVKRYLPKGPLKYIKLAIRLLKKDYDVLFVTGKICLFVSWILKPIHKKKIFFDAFISDYDNLVNDRKVVKKSSLKAKFLWLIDKFSCQISDYIILDTKEHVKYFVNEFGLNKKKFYVVYIGADENIFYPRKSKKTKDFLVSFHGTFIPLQGIEYIVKAAKKLEGKNIVFEIIGKGQTYNKIVDLANRLKVKNVSFLGFKKIHTLPKYVSKADVCLGIFGNTEKTKRVIPNKAYEVIAMKKCLITADTKAINELFEHKKNIYLCKVADENSLAKAILNLKKNRKLLNKISKNGYLLFKDVCTSKIIGKNLYDYIKSKL